MEILNSEVSVLVGGKAGEGINRAGQVVAEILSGLGYEIYMNFDHPSLIKGGHNFSIVRASAAPAGGIRKNIDIVIALDKNTINLHRGRFFPETTVIFNSDRVKKVEGTGIPADSITKEAGGIPIMANSCLIGAFCRAAGLEWEFAEEILRKEFPVKTSLNIEIARKGYEMASPVLTLKKTGRESGKVVQGSEAIGLGLCFGGIEGYVAYPMSPASGILHFLASKTDEFGIKVFQPEGEIAAVLMAEGMACCGYRSAVGTSGGGFCLMNEGLSYSGIAEVPLVIVNAQRQSPSTGAPTYTAQSDLPYVISAGHGEFPRIVISPGDAGQAFVWSARAAGLAWKYQIPVIILTDVTLNDSFYSFDPEAIAGENIEYGFMPAREGEYLRYRFTENGISPMAFFSKTENPVKINGKTHDESGISTDDPQILDMLAEKRILKSRAIEKDLEHENSVVVSGNTGSDTVVVSWGSNAPLCTGVCTKMGLKSVQPVILHPFPKKRFAEALGNRQRIIVMEDNSTGQLADLMKNNGFPADEKILNYSGRQLTVEELESCLREVL